MKMGLLKFIAALILAIYSIAPAFAWKPYRAGEAKAAPSVQVPAVGTLEVGFSPEGSAKELVLRFIRSATKGQRMRILAYALTSQDVVDALVTKYKEGVNIAVVADYTENFESRSSKHSIAALNVLANAGVPIRVVSEYPAMHEKVIIIEDSVEWGSFNYTGAAERSNSENATVAWHNPALAQAYLLHWKSRWDQGKDYRVPY